MSEISLKEQYSETYVRDHYEQALANRVTYLGREAIQDFAVNFHNAANGTAPEGTTYDTLADDLGEFILDYKQQRGEVIDDASLETDRRLGDTAFRLLDLDLDYAYSELDDPHDMRQVSAHMAAIAMRFVAASPSRPRDGEVIPVETSEQTQLRIADMAIAAAEIMKPAQDEGDSTLLDELRQILIAPALQTEQQRSAYGSLGVDNDRTIRAEAMLQAAVLAGVEDPEYAAKLAQGFAESDTAIAS